jgi:hypothetical protein
MSSSKATNKLLKVFNKNLKKLISFLCCFLGRMVFKVEIIGFLVFTDGKKNQRFAFSGGCGPN